MLLRSDETRRLRPQLVIAHSEPDYVAAVERLFRQNGWSVARAVA